MKKPEPIKGKFNTEVNRTAQEIAIRKRGARITHKAIEHFQKHRSNWVNQSYAKKLKSKWLPEPELTPDGKRVSPLEKATKAARLSVEGNFKSRLDNIKAKVERMVDRSKGNDPTRPRGRDKDLDR